MGLRGPKPTPTKVLEIRGSWRSKTRKGEHQGSPGRPACPSWLSAAAKKVWQRLIPQLAAAGLVSQLDALALGRYCMLYARWHTLEEWLQTHNEDEQYLLRSYASNGLQKHLAQLEASFGLSPAARAGLGLSIGKQGKEQDHDKRRFFD